MQVIYTPIAFYFIVIESNAIECLTYSTQNQNDIVWYRGADVFATCEAGYIFKYGETAVEVACEDGEWVYPGRYGTESGALVCVAICVPACQNAGTCIAPGVCACNENYSGDHCQNKESCSSGMPRLPNSLTENV